MFYFWLFAFYVFCFGACIASFLNVCIWRIPREESVVNPPSHCPKCNARIKWYQNIPIVSWCCLRGKCANCHEPISVRYTIVELLGGILFLMAYLQWAPGFQWAPQGVEQTIVAPPFGLVALHSAWMVPIYCLIFTGLILGSFVDLEHFWIPDRVTVGGVMLGVPLSCLVPELQAQGIRALPWFDVGQLEWWQSAILSVTSSFMGGFVLWFLGWVFTKILHKDAMGFGDVKLVAAIGAFFGPVAVFFVFLFSSMVGAIGGLTMVCLGKTRLGAYKEIPFGPYIAIATVLWMFWGPVMVKAYLSMGLAH